MADNSKITTPAPATVVAPEPDVVQQNDGKVTLTQAAFDQMIADMAELKQVQELSLQIDGKNKINKIEEMRRAGKLVKDVKLRMLDNKIILGWKTLQDDVYFQDGKLVEIQRISVFFEDATTKEIPLLQWAALPVYVKGEVIGETRTADGDLIFKVKLSDGKEVDVSVKYVN